jgi:thioredoxin-like negative regulator of GroEL
VHGLRSEYQDRVNFVILDFDDRADRGLASRLDAARHPAYAVVAPDSDEVVERRFGPQPETALREWLDAVVARYGD